MCRPATTSCSRSPTPAAGMDAETTRSHLRAVLHDQGSAAKAPGSGWRRCTASCSRAGGAIQVDSAAGKRHDLPHLSAAGVGRTSFRRCRRRPDPRRFRAQRRCSSPKTSRCVRELAIETLRGAGLSGCWQPRHGDEALASRPRTRGPDSHPGDRRRDARHGRLDARRAHLRASTGAQSDLHLRLYRRCGWRAPRDRGGCGLSAEAIHACGTVREGPRGRWPGWRAGYSARAYTHRARRR